MPLLIAQTMPVLRSNIVIFCSASAPPLDTSSTSQNAVGWCVLNLSLGFGCHEQSLSAGSVPGADGTIQSIS